MPPSTYKSRRQRKTLSCNDCRNLKRKCDRRQPCSNCLRTVKSCIYSAQETFSEVVRSQPSLHSEPLFDPDTHNLATTMPSVVPPNHIDNSSNAEMELVDVNLNSTAPSIKSLLSQRLFVKALLALWFRELDYMYDIVRGTPAEMLVFEDRIDQVDYDQKYVPLLAVILALTAQLHGPDLDAVMSACIDPLLSSKMLVEPAITLAKDTVDEFLDALDSEDGERTILPEYLQASLLVCAFFKNAGQMDRYRRRLYRDISCLIHASYHVLDSFSLQIQHHHHKNNFASTISKEDLRLRTPRFIRALQPEQRGLVRRIFWAYFTCDRLYFMIGGPTSSYVIIPKHCNIWCYEKIDDGRMQNIQELCHGQDGRNLSTQDFENVNGTHRSSPIYLGQQGNSNRILISNRLRSSESTFTGGLSRFARGMVQVSASAGRCLDQISLVQKAQPLHPGSEEEATEELSEYEENLAIYRIRCFNVASLVEEQLTLLEKEYKLGERGFNSGVSPPCSVVEEARRQNHILVLTIYRLRRDVALSLGVLVHSAFPSFRPWLDHKEMITSRALLEMIFLVPVEVPPRSMGWIFYLHYIAEPTTGLIKSISNIFSIEEMRSLTIFKPEEAKESLQLAFKGRNLLCLIAAQSQVPLAQSLATKVCHQLHTQLPSICDVSILEANTQIDIGSMMQRFYRSHMFSALQQKEKQQLVQGSLIGNTETLRARTNLASSPQNLPTQFETFFAQDGVEEQQQTPFSFASYISSLADSFSLNTQENSGANFNANQLADAWESLFAMPFHAS